jgi:hypothetical protein
VLYGLRVIEAFKGAPAPRIDFFQERNSGAFYLEVDKDYLLFLHRIRPSQDGPEAARGALRIKYACGQSRSWEKVRASELAVLRNLSGQRQ